MDGKPVLSLLLRERDIDFVVLAGFLAPVPDYLLRAYPNVCQHTPFVTAQVVVFQFVCLRRVCLRSDAAKLIEIFMSHVRFTIF